jgi:response regulator RpfG family c-di-GMP phosphodiesterase
MTNQPQILCVDDEPNILQSLRRLFRREPYQLHFAPGAEEAFNILEAQAIDLIISDNRMPNMTGVQFLGAVKARWPETVRIILSGYTEVSSITQAINEGHIYKFILKPWEDDQLLATVRECLEMAASAKENRHFQKLQNERRQVLSEALRLSQVILDALPVAVIGVSEENIVFTNRAAELTFGSGSGSLLVSRIGDVLSREMEHHLRQAQAERTPGEFGYVHRDGTSYRAVCALLPGPHDGALICLLPRPN